MYSEVHFKLREEIMFRNYGQNITGKLVMKRHRLQMNIENTQPNIFQIAKKIHPS